MQSSSVLSSGALPAETFIIAGAIFIIVVTFVSFFFVVMVVAVILIIIVVLCPVLVVRSIADVFTSIIILANDALKLIKLDVLELSTMRDTVNEELPKILILKKYRASFPEVLQFLGWLF